VDIVVYAYSMGGSLVTSFCTYFDGIYGTNGRFYAFIWMQCKDKCPPSCPGSLCVLPNFPNP